MGRFISFLTGRTSRSEKLLWFNVEINGLVIGSTPYYDVAKRIIETELTVDYGHRWYYNQRTQQYQLLGKEICVASINRRPK